MAKLGGLLNAQAVDARAVAAAQVFDHQPQPVKADFGMTAADIGLRQDKIILLAAPDDDGRAAEQHIFLFLRGKQKVKRGGTLQ